MTKKLSRNRGAAKSKTRNPSATVQVHPYPVRSQTAEIPLQRSAGATVEQPLVAHGLVRVLCRHHSFYFPNRCCALHGKSCAQHCARRRLNRNVKGTCLRFVLFLPCSSTATAAHRRIVIFVIVVVVVRGVVARDDAPCQQPSRVRHVRVQQSSACNFQCMVNNSSLLPSQQSLSCQRRCHCRRACVKLFCAAFQRKIADYLASQLRSSDHQ